MRFEEDYEEPPKVAPILKIAILMAGLMIVGIMLFVVIKNRETMENQYVTNSELLGDSDSGTVLPEKNEFVGGILSPDDFDFWDMYPETTDDNVNNNVNNNTATQSDPATDGRHTLVTDKYGIEEWVLISPYLPKHTYDFNDIRKQNGLYVYYQNTRVKSYNGIQISSEQGEVDFKALKEEGVDFVILKVGMRGYSTGELAVDKNFAENLKSAIDANLKVGVYFTSQAITVAEIKEEVAFVLSKIEGYNISYPIAFEMNYALNDQSRIEALSRDEKTALTKLFVEMVEVSGYSGIILGDKEWLVKELNLTELVNLDVWIYQNQVLPDYPYEFAMWSYKVDVAMSGISGTATGITSFVDYSVK